MNDACFEAQMLCFCKFWFFEDLGGQMYVDVRIMHIMKPKSFILWILVI